MPARASLPSSRDERDMRLFLAATVLMGLGACVNSSVYNNYLKEVFDLDVARRTFLEFPRETPGFLVALFVGALAAIGEVRIAMVATLAASGGMLALGWIPASFWIMVLATFVFSAGQHVNMPLANVIGMSFAKDGGEGKVLGKVQAASFSALVTGSFVLLLLFRLTALDYRGAFTAGAVCYFAAAAALLLMSPRRDPGETVRFVVRAEYGRFYVLSLLYGARKQLFITFGPWMIVDLFRQPVSTMTLLYLLVYLMNIGLQPVVGRLTDRLGSRVVLGAEAIITIGVCAVYAFAPEFLPPGAALVVVSLCFIADQGANGVSMARSIYAKRLVRRPEDLSPTLSLGISIDHIASMSIPMLGGLLWRLGEHGYRWVFLGGALVSLLNFMVTRGMPRNAGADGEAAPPALAGADPRG